MTEKNQELVSDIGEVISNASEAATNLGCESTAETLDGIAGAREVTTGAIGIKECIKQKDNVALVSKIEPVFNGLTKIGKVLKLKLKRKKKKDVLSKENVESHKDDDHETKADEGEKYNKADRGNKGTVADDGKEDSEADGRNDNNEAGGSNKDNEAEGRKEDNEADVTNKDNDVDRGNDDNEADGRKEDNLID